MGWERGRSSVPTGSKWSISLRWRCSRCLASGKDEGEPRAENGGHDGMQSWRAIGLGSSESREDSEVQEEMPRAQERPQENGRDGRSSFSAPTEGKIGLYTSQKKIPVGAQCDLFRTSSK